MKLVFSNNCAVHRLLLYKYCIIWCVVCCQELFLATSVTGTKGG